MPGKKERINSENIGDIYVYSKATYESLQHITDELNKLDYVKFSENTKEVIVERIKASKDNLLEIINEDSKLTDYKIKEIEDGIEKYDAELKFAYNPKEEPESGKVIRAQRSIISTFKPEQILTKNKEVSEALKSIDSLFNENVENAFSKLENSPYATEILSAESLWRSKISVESAGRDVHYFNKAYDNGTFTRHGQFDTYLYKDIPVSLFKAQSTLQSVVYNIDLSIYQLEKSDMTLSDNKAKLDELTEIKKSFTECVEKLSDEAHVINIYYIKLGLDEAPFTANENEKLNEEIEPQQRPISAYTLEHLTNEVRRFSFGNSSEKPFIPIKNIKSMEKALTELQSAYENKDTTDLADKITDAETQLKDFFKAIPNLDMLRDIHNVNTYQSINPSEVKRKYGETDSEYNFRQKGSVYTFFRNFVQNIADDARNVLENVEFSKKYADRLFEDLSKEIELEYGFKASGANSMDEYIEKRETEILNNEILKAHPRAQLNFDTSNAAKNNGRTICKDIDAITDSFDKIIASKNPEIKQLSDEIDLSEISRKLLSTYAAIEQADEKIEDASASTEQLAAIVYNYNQTTALLNNAIQYLEDIVKPNPNPPKKTQQNQQQENEQQNPQQDEQRVERKPDTRTADERYKYMFFEDINTISQSLEEYKKQKLDPVISQLDEGEFNIELEEKGNAELTAQANEEKYISMLAQTVPKTAQELREKFNPMIQQLQQFVDFYENEHISESRYYGIYSVYSDARNLINDLSKDEPTDSEEFYNRIVNMQHSAAFLESGVVDAAYSAEHLAKGEGSSIAPLSYAPEEDYDKLNKIRNLLEPLQPLVAQCNSVLKETGTYVEKTELQNGRVKRLNKFAQTKPPLVEQYKDNHNNLMTEIDGLKKKMQFSEAVKDIPVEEMNLDNMLERAAIFKDSINIMFKQFGSFGDKFVKFFNRDFDVFTYEIKSCEKRDDYFLPSEKNSGILTDESDFFRMNLHDMRDNLQNSLDAVINLMNERRRKEYPGQVDMRDIKSAFYDAVIDDVTQFKVVVDNIFVLENNEINKKTIKLKDYQKDIKPLPLTGSPKQSEELARISSFWADPFTKSLFGVEDPIITKKAGEKGLGVLQNPDRMEGSKDENILDQMAKIGKGFGFDDNSAEFLIANEKALKEISNYNQYVEVDVENDENMTNAEKSEILDAKYTELNNELDRVKNSVAPDEADGKQRQQEIETEIKDTVEKLRIVKNQTRLDEIFDNAKLIVNNNEKAEIQIQEAEKRVQQQRKEAINRRLQSLQVENTLNFAIKAEKEQDVSNPEQSYQDMLERAKSEARGRTNAAKPKPQKPNLSVQQQAEIKIENTGSIEIGSQPVVEQQQNPQLEVAVEAQQNLQPEVAVEAQQNPQPEVAVEAQQNPQPEVAEEAQQNPQPEVAVEAEQNPQPEVAEEAQQNPQPEVAVEAEQNPQPEVAVEAQQNPQPEVAEEAQQNLQPEVAVEDQQNPQPEVAEEAQQDQIENAEMLNNPQEVIHEPVENNQIQNNADESQDIEIDQNNIIDTSVKHEEARENANAKHDRGENEADMQTNITSIRKKFQKRAGELEKALSPWKNSKEYKELIKAVRQVGNGNTKDELKGLNAADQFAKELYLVHNLTEKYLAHKAKDGVNKNAYQKLCVVEETSKVVEEALRMIGERDLKYNLSVMEAGQAENLPHKTSDMKVSLESRKRLISNDVKNQIPELSDEVCAARADAYKAGNQKKAANVDVASIGRVIRDVDNCMCKILIKALNKPQASVDKSAVRSLQAMRNHFLANPFPPVKEEPEPVARNEAPVIH